MADKRKLQGEISLRVGSNASVEPCRPLAALVFLEYLSWLNEQRSLNYAAAIETNAEANGCSWKSGYTVVWHQFLVFTPQMISGEIHVTFVNFWCLLNASFGVSMRFTDVTFILASVSAARDRQTFTKCRESRSLKRYFHLSGTDLYLCDCPLVLDYSDCCCLKPPQQNVAQRLVFLWMCVYLKGWESGDRLALWQTPEQGSLRVQTNTLCFQWGPASSPLLLLSALGVSFSSWS